MTKRINLDEEKCKKCGGDTKPLFNRERYCPKCEGDDEPTEPNWNRRIKGDGFEIIDIDFDDMFKPDKKI